MRSDAIEDDVGEEFDDGLQLEESGRLKQTHCFAQADVHSVHALRVEHAVHHILRRQVLEHDLVSLLPFLFEGLDREEHRLVGHFHEAVRARWRVVALRCHLQITI
ncbi:hypothetical protein WR25_16334 [Diploscapter pachys]|uniref:Uncharacterized protein n=1 Tax=Diploscapter pachys TaxID=2018661 RepID=A0A2A2JDC7_9BILA|nr:hypothetical protein WR25_16334 [Diploscapter pachys]